MDKYYENIIQQLKEGFQANKGKGYCFIYKQIDPIPIVVDLVISLKNKNPNREILICLEEYKYKALYKKYLTDNNYDEEEYYNKIQFLSHSYMKSNFKNRDVFISLGVNDDEDMLIRETNNNKFSLIIFTKGIMNNKFIDAINQHIKQIPIKLDSEKLLYKKIYSPVEEYRHFVVLTDDDKELYEKYDKYIKDSISIFGSLEQIELCRTGNYETRSSAIDECYKIAKRNGWHNNLDKSLEYNQQIDELFNPVALRERVNNIFNITNNRKKLLTDNNEKLYEIKKIIDSNRDKKILIISARGEFCNEITKYLNSFSDEKYNALGYHNELEDSYLTDENGNIIVWKSGSQKGEPRLFKAKSLCTNNLNAFKIGYTNILCIKASSKNELDIDIDIVIFTTTLIDNIFDIKRRFSLINFKSPTIVHRIYIKDTTEEKTLMKEKPSSLINISQNDFAENLLFDENSGDIIL